MKAISELFDETRLVVPVDSHARPAGESPLSGRNLSVVPLERPKGHDLGRKLRLPMWLLKNFSLIYREVRDADAVHTPIPGDIGTIGLLIAMGLRKPLFIRYCGNWEFRRTAAEYFWRWLMERAAGSRTVVLATGGGAEPPSRRNANIRWIFSTSLRESELREFGAVRDRPSPNGPCLIIAARQERAKGTGAVIEALTMLGIEYPGISLDVVGDGEALPEFRRLAESRGVAHRVRFHGKVDHSGVLRLLRKADLFCFPTTSSEGFPKAVHEALACGVPVITTRVSVLGHLIGAGGGVLLDDATASEVARGVRSCLSGEDRYRELSAAAVRTAADYSLERWRDTIASFLTPGWGPLRSLTRDLAGLKVSFVAGTLGQGGAERQLFYIVSALKNAGGAPRVLCLTHGEHWQARIESLGVEVEWVGRSRFRALRLLTIIRELRRHRPDVVQSQHFYTNLYVSAAARVLGLPEIGALRNDAIEETTSNPGFLGRRSLRMPRAVAANSRAGIENAINLGAAPDRLFLLPNVVDTSLFTPTLHASDNQVRLLMVARLVRAKRVDRFLRLILALRRRSRVPICGVVAGDGILRRELELQANELGLDETLFRFLGRVGETSALYGDASILIITSDREGTPNAVLEAMACGVPVVGTRVGGMEDLVFDGETGYLLHAGDEDAMATAVLGLVDDRPKLRQFGTRARAFVEQHHALELLPDHLLRLYSAVLSRSRGVSRARNAEFSRDVTRTTG